MEEEVAEAAAGEEIGAAAEVVQERLAGRILDDVLANYKADPKCIHLTGLSRGGHGTWGLAELLPDTFASIAPIAGNPSAVKHHGRLAKSAIWVAHNRGDNSAGFAQVDQTKYGLPVDVFVSISLSSQTDQALKDFEQAVQRLDEVMECYLMTGSRDYLLRVVCDGLNSYERFTREQLTTLPGIRSIESSFALGRVKQRGALPEV